MATSKHEVLVPLTKIVLTGVTTKITTQDIIRFGKIYLTLTQRLSV